MPNPVVVDEIASVVPITQIQRPKSGLLRAVPAARSSESHVGNGRERVPPKRRRLDFSIRDLCETIVRDWWPTNVPACVAQEVLLRRKLVNVDAPPTYPRSHRRPSSSPSDLPIPAGRRPIAGYGGEN
jgi:hypothetical protein